jgi:TetR/AcrR family transcriptional repressor of nem operon
MGSQGTRKERTRERILDVASALFRRDGIAETGVARLMAEAGLTHGGFYAHFSSKEDLVRDSLARALDGTRADLVERVATGGIRALVGIYLSRAHRDHPEAGCVGASLLTEVTRHAPGTRSAVAGRLDALEDLIGHLLPESWDDAKRAARARAILSLMVGALQRARLAPSEADSLAQLRDGAEGALMLAEEEA